MGKKNEKFPTQVELSNGILEVIPRRIVHRFTGTDRRRINPRKMKSWLQIFAAVTVLLPSVASEKSNENVTYVHLSSDLRSFDNGPWSCRSPEGSSTVPLELQKADELEAKKQEALQRVLQMHEHLTEQAIVPVNVPLPPALAEVLRHIMGHPADGIGSAGSRGGNENQLNSIAHPKAESVDQNAAYVNVRTLPAVLMLEYRVRQRAHGVCGCGGLH
ncbi:hypothetical protein DFH09DRAFT_1281651 [Mycena vulgaris]|nr:hypothetical protein DFH09DRAFT_1281651 [Mycena vulgaris]